MAAETARKEKLEASRKKFDEIVKAGATFEGSIKKDDRTIGKIRLKIERVEASRRYGSVFYPEIPDSKANFNAVPIVDLKEGRVGLRFGTGPVLNSRKYKELNDPRWYFSSHVSYIVYINSETGILEGTGQVSHRKDGETFPITFTVIM